MLENIENYFANFADATTTCRTVALWITMALVLAFTVSKLYIAAVGKYSEKYDAAALSGATRILNGAWIIISLIAAAGITAAFTGCYFSDVAKGKDVLVPILFYPLLTVMITVLAGGVTLFVKPCKISKIVCASVCGIAFIAALVCLIVYYTSGAAVENNYGTDVSSNIGLYSTAAIIAVGIGVLAYFSDRHPTPLDTKAITFGAVCVALSFALSYVRLFKMPMGGSITFASMLPIMLFAFMFGSRKGVFVGAVYGIMQAVQDPWIIHPAQFVLDYLAAFASVGLVGSIRGFGMFKGNMRAQFALGASVACLFRFLNHYFAGVFAFGVYAEGYASEYGIPMLANEYFYSFVYQSMYLLPELAIVIAVGMLVMASSNFRKQIQFYARIKEPIRTAAVAVSAENTVSAAADDGGAGVAEQETVPES